MSKQRISIILLAVMLAGCADESNSFRDQYRWLSGKWEGKDGETQVIETWKWQRYRFEGEGFRIDDGDTTSTERLYISAYGPAIGYTALLNEEEFLSFQADNAVDNKLIVRNKRNDFPKMISYELTSDSSLLITLEGEMRGTPVSTSYSMQRKSRER